MYQNGNGQVVITSALDMNNNGVIFGIPATGSAQLKTENAITGTGNITLIQNSSSGSFTIGGVDNSGEVIHSGTGSSSADQINGHISTNVTAIRQQSASAKLDIRGGTFNINSIGTSSLINTGGASINLKQSTSGTGNLVLSNNTSTDSAVWTGEGTLNHTGDILCNGTGTGSTKITSSIGNNITEIIQNSSTSQFNIYDGTLTVYTTGTGLINNGGLKMDIKENTTGNGNLIFANNTATDDAIYYKEKILNHTGTILNTGTGSGITRLSSNSKIGANVTEIIQDSATSPLIIESDVSHASHQFSGNVTINQGTLQTTKLNLLVSSSNVRIASGAILNLNHVGTNTIRALFLNGRSQRIGVYNSSNASPYITGAGELLVTEYYPFPIRGTIFQIQ